MSGRFQTALHILTLLQVSNGQSLSSDYIAGSLNINPVLVRKEISNLKSHGMITSKEGKNGGYTLNKPAVNITLAEVYQAVQDSSLLGQAKNQPNPACTVGKSISRHLNGLSGQLDQMVLKELSGITLAKFSKQFN